MHFSRRGAQYHTRIGPEDALDADVAQVEGTVFTRNVAGVGGAFEARAVWLLVLLIVAQLVTCCDLIANLIYVLIDMIRGA